MGAATLSLFCVSVGILKESFDFDNDCQKIVTSILAKKCHSFISGILVKLCNMMLHYIMKNCMKTLCTNTKVIEYIYVTNCIT